MKRILKLLAFLIMLPLLYVASNLLYSTLADFTPPEHEEVRVFNPQSAVPDSVVTLLTWNIGYAGLGVESDFFYDGGVSVRMSEQLTRKNMEGILQTLTSLDSVDIIMLQEVDTFSKRSWWANEFEEISAALPSHSGAFTLNYQVDFVPIPWTDPMGRVKGGLASFSRFGMGTPVRHQLPSSFPWPDRIYFLDRCLLVKRIPLSNGRELVVINLHNSAFDEEGTLKAAELAYLKELLLEEEAKGNPTIVGGDWNQGAPGTGFDEVPAELLPGWKWAFDARVGTNRALKAAYEAGVTPTFVIDHYLVSSGLEVEEVRTIDMGFIYSDHQPVYLRVRLD